jgi:hypothetical protein
LFTNRTYFSNYTFLKKIKELTNNNKDIFASKDSELSHTSIVKMKIDTGQHLPIQLAYRAPLHKREVIEKAVDEMLSANIIRKSRSA